MEKNENSKNLSSASQPEYGNCNERSHNDESSSCSKSKPQETQACSDCVSGLNQHPSPHSFIRNETSLHNWQASKKSLKEKLDFVLNKQLLADVHFLVGKGDLQKKIPAHKFVLSVGSAVFDSMFNSQLATRESCIKIPDVEPSAFKALLQFLYTDDVMIDADIVMTTLYAAKKYVVPALEGRCVDFLKNNLHPQNAFMLLTQARLFDEPQLASLCLECIDQNTKEALNAEGFTEIDVGTLERVLKRDSLGGLRECHIFKAVESWADAECLRKDLSKTRENRRKVLENVISLVRFPLMTVEEFAQGPAQSGTLQDREIVDMFLYFTLNPKPEVQFSEVPRCSSTGKEYTLRRFNGVSERWGYSGTSDTIRFSVDHKIRIIGFGLYGATVGPSNYEVDIELRSFENQQNIIAQSKTGFTCDGSKKTFRVLFRNPVEIKPDVSYIASATITGQESFYGTGGRRYQQMSVAAMGGSKVKFTFNYVKGNNNGTSVEDGQIPEIIFYV